MSVRFYAKVFALAASAAFAIAAVSSEPSTQPEDNLQYWLGRAKPAGQCADSQPAEPQGTNPFKSAQAGNPDAAPGVVELSDGTIIAGYVYTTHETPLKVYVADERRWRRVPLLAALSVNAVVVAEEMRPHWRFGETGQPEKFYTGKEYPYRRFLWKIHLADGTHITGVIKGQPIWVAREGQRRGPFVLHERLRGPLGGELEDLIYIERIIISRRCMEQVLSSRDEGAGEGDDENRRGESASD